MKSAIASSWPPANLSVTSAVATLTVTAPNPLPPGCLGIAYVAGQVILTWCTNAPLQAAPAVTGPWTNVPGASSPYTNDLSPETPEMFFRLHQQGQPQLPQPRPASP